ncbi:hypothetical protein [Spirosoma oryzicola]|uniref:hypothetical protein n=1 Tax=Spirosoma oryzicola TaxID=2898794 RepID=UPI001E53652E|nr:hypothetical protein [Spirosoma oryzicola]UHG93962.1 hypothetical protein LQ777_24665 [Spirosoma oryzicola]
MKKMLIPFAMLALLAINSVHAQDVKKKAATAEAKAQVAADKADLKMNKAARKADKMVGDEAALKADRKAHMKAEEKLIKDQAKKDVKVVKKKL